MNSVALTHAVLNLAASEALAAGYQEIGLGHFLLALTKLAELDDAVPESAFALSARQEFEELGVDTRRFRRQLRATFGRGSEIVPGAVVRVTPACEAAIARALELSQAVGLPLDSGFLVRAVFRGLIDPETPADAPQKPTALDEIPTEL